MRRATSAGHREKRGVLISTHAPREGSDHYHISANQWVQYISIQSENLGAGRGLPARAFEVPGVKAVFDRRNPPIIKGLPFPAS